MSIVFSLIGGLGFFLYGMKMMSDGLEKAAGAKMRRILEMFTKNRILGILVGTVFTAVIQSSSATTVMVVSFVNAGLMSLTNAAGVILGANIGTTVTSQLIAFNLSEVAPLFVMAGVIMLMFCKNNNIQKIGEVILGFGVLFVGLSTMSGAMSTLKDSPQIVEILGSLTNHYLAVLVGFAVTAVLQSSSATVGIVLLLATQGLLELPICLFIIMGCNIGSCVSALIASLGGKREAKRAAWIHFLFNIFGTAIFLVIFAFALDLIVDFIYRISGENISRSVANAHTLIKVCEVIMLFPFVNWIVKATYFIIPEKNTGKAEPADLQACELQFIGKNSVFSPTTAVLQAVQEMENMGSMAVNNLTRAMNALVTLDEEDLNTVYKVEKTIDFLDRRITNYLVDLNQSTLPIDDARSIGALFHVVNDIERIGDHAENIADAAVMRREDNVTFSRQGEKDLSDMLDMVIKITTYAIEMFSHNDTTHMEEIRELEDRIDEKERELQQKHIERLTKGECTPEAGMIFSDIVSGLERVADHATNIAFAILENSREEEETAENPV